MVALIIPTFIAGILTFLAPCTFPLVPAYLGLISGTSIENLTDKKKSAIYRKRTFLNGLFYVLGFSLVFISFGVLAGFIGQQIGTAREVLTRIGGILVIIFGLLMIGILKVPFLQKTKKFSLPSSAKPGTPTSSFLIGSIFAFGWTPCVGPILGTVLTFATNADTILQGVFLMAIFSLGLALPFLIIAFSIGSAVSYLKKINKYLTIINVFGGIFLIAIGFLLATNNIGLLLRYGYQWFTFINYDRLLDYL